MFAKIESDVFWLSVILIVVAYYAGATQFGVRMIGAITNFLLVSTGRDKNGNFASYPGNAPATTAV